MKKIVLFAAAIVLFAAGCNSQNQSTTNNALNPPSSSNSQVRNSTNTSATATPSTGTVKTYNVTASDFKFTPNNIMVNKGDAIKIIFTNSDPDDPHNFTLDEYSIKTAPIVKKDSPETVQFTADKTGNFEFYCAVDHHRQMGMKGTLVVK